MSLPVTTAEADATGLGKRKTVCLRLGLVVGAATVAYAVALSWSGTSASAQVIQGMGVLAGILALVLCLLNYALRGLRWRLWMTLLERPMGLREAMRLYTAAFVLTPSPGNVGEAVRSLWLSRRALPMGTGLALFGAERIADLLALLALALPALGWLVVQHGPTLMRAAPAWAWVIAALGVGLLAFAGPHAVRHVWSRQAGWLRQVLTLLRHRPAQWAALSSVAWLGQGLALALLCDQAGLTLGPWLAVSCYALAMVAGALSSLPAGLGGTEATLAALLASTGASWPEAIGLTLAIRVLTVWLAVGIGAIALASAVLRKEIAF